MHRNPIVSAGLAIGRNPFRTASVSSYGIAESVRENCQPICDTRRLQSSEFEPAGARLRMGKPDTVTRLLLSWTAGDDTALERLLPSVDAELRRLARRY